MVVDTADLDQRVDIQGLAPDLTRLIRLVPVLEPGGLPELDAVRKTDMVVVVRGLDHQIFDLPSHPMETATDQIQNMTKGDGHFLDFFKYLIINLLLL